MMPRLPLRLSKAQRLQNPAQFQHVYQSKQWGNSALFTFNVLATQTVDKPAALGVTVSKKVSKRAVDRNRIKRQIKEFYRHHQNQLNNANLVITAKPKCLNATDDERQNSLSDLWHKVLAWQRWHKRQQEKNEIVDISTEIPANNAK